ncbi:MAG: hypothetical protein CL947_00250 [Epsilonproteobacteria bacterium]|nr:hypothetical protein [Campylobacterota bacterium]|tara:strand:- start:8937 stop:9140 length:204 start_codon:yes stop_codon:yes gene_type:complete
MYKCILALVLLSALVVGATQQQKYRFRIEHVVNDADFSVKVAQQQYQEMKQKLANHRQNIKKLKSEK